MQRQQLLERLKEKIIRSEEEIGRLTLHRMLLDAFFMILIMHEVTTAGEEMMRRLHSSDISVENGRKVVELLDEIAGALMQFERTQEEGRAIMADLFAWVAGEIARPHHAALHTQELHDPEKIYGVEGRTEEIPFD